MLGVICNTVAGLGWLAFYGGGPCAPDHEPENDQYLAKGQYGELISNTRVSWEEQRCHANAQPTKTSDDKKDAKKSGNKPGSKYKKPEG